MALQVVSIILVICVVVAILVLSSMVVTNRHDELLTRASSLKGDIREHRKSRYLIGKRTFARDAELSSAIDEYPTIRRESDEVRWERKWLPRMRRHLGKSDNEFTRNEEALSDARDELAYVEGEIAKIEGSKLQMLMIDLFVRSTRGARLVRDKSRQAQRSLDEMQQSISDKRDEETNALGQHPRQYGDATYFGNARQKAQKPSQPEQRRHRNSGWSQTSR